MGEKCARLNESRYCGFCEVTINPFVIQRSSDDSQTVITLECSNCEKRWGELEGVSKSERRLNA
jgi:hypothetical protein